jgi:hypothetical protein
MGFYAIYGNVLTADVICLCMRKFNIPERYKTVRECTCEREREREREKEREREGERERERERKREKMDRMESHAGH